MDPAVVDLEILRNCEEDADAVLEKAAGVILKTAAVAPSRCKEWLEFVDRLPEVQYPRQMHI